MRPPLLPPTEGAGQVACEETGVITFVALVLAVPLLRREGFGGSDDFSLSVVSNRLATPKVPLPVCFLDGADGIF
jgi:hypothetical protein